MAAQSNQPASGKPRDDDQDKPIPGRPEPLGLDDVTDAERAGAGALGREGGLGFDDLSDAELERLAGVAPEEGGLGLDDLLIVPEDEDERAA